MPLHGSTKLEESFDLCISSWNLAYTEADLAHAYTDQRTGKFVLGSTV